MMRSFLSQGLWFAQIDPVKDIEAMRQSARSASRTPSTDLMVIMGIALSLVAILFFWAFFIRKRPKHARGALVVQRADRHSDPSHGSSGRRRRRKRRPEHPDNWGRNPTLGETGGLPPSRPDEPDAPSEPESPPAR